MKVPAFRIILTVALLVGAFGLSYVWESFSTPIRGEIAVGQINDSDVDYALAKRVAAENVPGKMIPWSVALGLVLIWGSWAISNRETLFPTRR